MESLCGCAATSGHIEVCLSNQSTSSPFVRARSFRSWFPGRRTKSASLSHEKRWRVRPQGASGSHGESNGAVVNGFSMLTHSPPFLESGMQHGDHPSCIIEESESVTAATSGSGTTGSKGGLFRTPISGGVQTATTDHDLPRPALAVRNLMEQAKFGHLCTMMSRMHHHRANYPVGSLVDFVSDATGHPIFSLSPLAFHTKNILANPKCSLVVQIPGWSSLSNARVTIFGDVFPIAAEQQEWARNQFVAKHQQWPSQQWNNFHYFRMQNIIDVYFIGGFGTVAWIDVKEYETVKPDMIAADSGEQNLKELNAIFSKPIKDILSTEVEIDDAAFISIDSKGTDVRVRQGAQFNIQRISFEVEREVRTLDDAKAALEKIINRHHSSKSQNGN